MISPALKVPFSWVASIEYFAVSFTIGVGIGKWGVEEKKNNELFERTSFITLRVWVCNNDLYTQPVLATAEYWMSGLSSCH